MNGRFVGVVAIIMMAGALTGCIEALSFLSTSDGEITALENRDLADNAAAAWNPDAQLVMVFALEAPNGTAPFPSDPVVGNGRAPLWFYGYQAANGTAVRAFQVSADGQVAAVNDSTFSDVPTAAGTAITNWRIDSDEAVRVARTDTRFAAVFEAPDAGLAAALGSEEGMTVWALIAGSESTGKGVIAIVNANEGSLLMVQTFESKDVLPTKPMVKPRGPQVEMEESGRVDASMKTVEYPFELDRPDSAVLYIQMQNQVPTDRLRYEIRDAAGEAVHSGTVGAQFRSASRADVFEIEDAGEFTLVLIYSSTVPMMPFGGVDYAFEFYVGPECTEFDGGANPQVTCKTSAST